MAKKKYKVLNPISLGGTRIEVDSVIELDEEVAKAYGKNYLQEMPKSARVEIKKVMRRRTTKRRGRRER